MFYHYTALTPGVTPRDGDACTYALGEGRNGKSAAFDIKLVAAAGTNDTSPSAAEAAVVFGGLKSFWVMPMHKLRGNILATAAMLVVIAIMLWSMP